VNYCKEHRLSAVAIYQPNKRFMQPISLLHLYEFEVLSLALSLFVISFFGQLKQIQTVSEIKIGIVRLFHTIYL